MGGFSGRQQGAGRLRREAGDEADAADGLTVGELEDVQGVVTVPCCPRQF